MNALERLYGEQSNINIDNIELSIEQADTLKKMNELRLACAKAMKTKPNILKLWQTKYWNMKKCPTCGHIKGD